MKKVVILISGRGSNMQALLLAAQAADFPAEIVCVLSNDSAAAGLKAAADAGIATDSVDHRVRRINTAGIITTAAGNGLFGSQGNNGLASAAQAGPCSAGAVRSSR